MTTFDDDFILPTHGIRIMLELICDECGDTDNYIAVRPGQCMTQLKSFRVGMKKAGWRIGNYGGKKTLCPECNKKGVNKT